MRLSLLALLTLLVLPASAQPTAGLRLGLTVSDLDFGENSGFEDAEGIDQQPRLGLALGVVADVPLTPALSFRPEVLYAQKGYVLEVDIRTTDPVSSEPVALQGTQRVEMDYVEVPLLLAVRVPTGSALDVAVEAGPSFAYRTRFHLDCDGDAITCDDDSGACAANRSCNGTSNCDVTYPSGGTNCDDGNKCTYDDKCSGSGGCDGTSVNCDDDHSHVCNVDRDCNGTKQCSEFYPGGETSCNDGKPCTYNDKCNGAGSCSGQTIACNDAPEI